MNRTTEISKSILVGLVLLTLVFASSSAYSWTWQFNNFASLSSPIVLDTCADCITTSDSHTSGGTWAKLTADNNSGHEQGDLWTDPMQATRSGFVTRFGFKIYDSAGNPANGFCYSTQTAGAHTGPARAVRHWIP